MSDSDFAEGLNQWVNYAYADAGRVLTLSYGASQYVRTYAGNAPTMADPAREAVYYLSEKIRKFGNSRRSFRLAGSGSAKS